MTKNQVIAELKDWLDTYQHQMSLPTMDTEDLLLQKEIAVKREILDKLTN